jgi:hypothetical protein
MKEIAMYEVRLVSNNALVARLRNAPAAHLFAARQDLHCYVFDVSNDRVDNARPRFGQLSLALLSEQAI